MPYDCYQRKKRVLTCDGRYSNRDCEYVHYCGIGIKEPAKPAAETSPSQEGEPSDKKTSEKKSE